MSAPRSSVRYRSIKPSREPLRRRLRELAAVRLSWGYQRLHILLRLEGWRINRKLTYRLYTEEGLTLKRVRPKRRKSAVRREGRPTTTAANQRWAMDFIHDMPADGRTVRILSVLDVHTRECVALHARQSFRGEDVGAVLNTVARTRPLPAVTSVNQGSAHRRRWTFGRTITRCSSTSPDPASRPTVILRTPFGATPMWRHSMAASDESAHWWNDPAEVQRTLDAWGEDYNNMRRHSGLAHESPVRDRGGGRRIPPRERLLN